MTHAAMSPAESISGVLDYTNKEHNKHYHTTTKGCTGDDDLYDLKESGLIGFLKQVRSGTMLSFLRLFP